MDAKQIQELLRKILSSEPVSVLLTDGREIPVCGLNMNGGEVLGWTRKTTGEFIPQAQVEAVII